jgi:hypothetical protein
MKTARITILTLLSLLMLVGFTLPASAAPAAAVATCQPSSVGFNPRYDLVRTLNAPDYNTATVTNKSAICAYDLGLAAYRKFDENINNQELFSFKTAVILPGQTLNLSVALPGCKAQIDLFYGSLLQSFSGNARYGTRLLAYRHVGRNYCTLPTGNQGCTPGYWKNHEQAWAVTGYSPNQIISTVFSNATLFPSLANKTMLQSLQGGGGNKLADSAKILLRAATAAVLDANNDKVAYPKIAAHVIYAVNQALASKNRDTILALATTLDGYNNGAGGCPLN